MFQDPEPRTASRTGIGRQGGFRHRRPWDSSTARGASIGPRRQVQRPLCSRSSFSPPRPKRYRGRGWLADGQAHDGGLRPFLLPCARPRWVPQPPAEVQTLTGLSSAGGDWRSFPPQPRRRRDEGSDGCLGFTTAEEKKKKKQQSPPNGPPPSHLAEMGANMPSPDVLSVSPNLRVLRRSHMPGRR